MKKIILTTFIIFIALTHTVQAQILPRDGWWSNLDEPGTGLNIDIQQGSLSEYGFAFASYYSYVDSPDKPSEWFVFAGAYQPASWTEWRNENTIGVIDGGQILRQSGGQCVGCEWSPNVGTDVGLGNVKIVFHDAIHATLHIGTFEQQLAWMDWGNDLVRPERCTPADSKQALPNCKYSLLDGGEWTMRGYLGLDFDESTSNSYTKASIYSPMVLNEATDSEKFRMNLSNYPTIGFDEVEDELVRIAVDFCPDTITLKACGDIKADGSTITSGDFKYMIVRDDISGDEYMFFYSGTFNEWMVPPEGFNYPVLKIVYIDENTAVAIGYEDTKCMLGVKDNCFLGEDALSNSYIRFKRILPSRDLEAEDVNNYADSFWTD